MKSVTVAGIDCGTNSIRLKVSRVSEDGVEDIVPRILRVIRLGQDVDKTHRFADEALARAYEAAREFAGVLAEHPVDGIRFVATSATRDAENREEFEDNIEKILGVRPEVIPGTEEADLSFLGATSIVHREVEAPYLVVDLGGGSTELVLGGDGVTHPSTQVQAAFSMNIGSVRMTERHLKNDPPTEGQIAEAVADIDAHIDEAFKTVPAGKYANQALASVGLYTGTEGDDGEYAPEIADKVALADKVGTAAAYVSTGDCVAGFVYSSDIFRYDGIEEAFVCPEDSHKPIVYPGAVADGSEHAGEAKAFIDFCLPNKKAQKIWAKYGFELSA